MEPWVADYIGIPYLERGRDRAGCDCWGLVRLVLEQQFQVSLPSLAGDYEAVDDALTQRLIDSTSAAVSAKPVTAPEPGDIAVLRVEGIPAHVGIVVGGGNLLHVRRGTESHVSRLASSVIAARLEGFYRVR